MNVAELLMNIENDYNGHKQTIIKGLTIEQGIQICKELEEYTSNAYSFVLEAWTDGNFTIYQKDYFGVDGAGGSTDRIIMGTA